MSYSEFKNEIITIYCMGEIFFYYLVGEFFEHTDGFSKNKSHSNVYPVGNSLFKITWSKDLWEINKIS